LAGGVGNSCLQVIKQFRLQKKRLLMSFSRQP